MKLHLFPCSLVMLLVFAGCKKQSNTSSTDAATPGLSAPSAGTQSGARPDDPVTLKLRWPVGNRFAQRLELNQTMNLPAPGGNKPARQEVTMSQDYALTVLRELDAGGREVEMEFQDVNMSVMMGGNEVLGFDTRGEATGDESNPAVRMLRLMVGQKLRFHLDASNRVEKVEGMKEFNAKVHGAGTAGNPMASMFNEEYFKQMMSAGRDFPAGEVKPGATWPSKSEVILGPLGKVTLDLVFTFKGWEDHGRRRCARLDYTGTMVAKDTDPASSMAAFMTVKGGESAGQSWFDLIRGMVIDTAIQQKIILEIKLPNRAGADPSAAPPETTLDQRISIKLVEESKK